MISAALFVVAIAAAMIYAIFYLAPETSWPRSIIKTVPLTCAAAMAVLLDAPPLLIGGLALSAVGDFALSRDGERWFIAGLVAFLAAHVAYIALFLGFADLDGWSVGSWIGAIALIAFGAVYLGLIWRRLGDMRFPVAAYVTVIVGMGVAAIALGGPFVILGSVLFIVSDSLLALEMFVLKDRRGWIAYAVWETYIAAQAAIALPFLAQMYA
jgi:uncharacterized membrane protein YhhN